jgi:hypothetical protein
MKKLKDLCLSVLINEGEDVISISPGEVGKILDVNFDSEDIKLDFETSYGKTMSLAIKISDFKNWLKTNKGKQADVFRHFIVDFLSNSSEGDESLNEIVDDDGNIMGDDDMPNNSTNSLVVGPKFDLEKIYKSFVPKSIRFYSGDLGIGVITW